MKKVIVPNTFLAPIDNSTIDPPKLYTLADLEKAGEEGRMNKRANELKEDLKFAIDCGYKVTVKNVRLEAENARLREALTDLVSCHSDGGFVQPDEDVLVAARQALTHSTPSHNGEIDPTHADYGSFKEKKEFSS